MSFLRLSMLTRLVSPSTSGCGLPGSSLVAILGMAALLSPTLPIQGADQHPPSKITFQGFLSDTATPSRPLGLSSPVNHTVVFRIYSSPTLPNSIWAEQQVVTIDKGHFSVLLGEGSPVGKEVFTNNLTGIFAGGSTSERFITVTVPALGLETTPPNSVSSSALCATHAWRKQTFGS